jgi:hypothetical protein
MQSGDVDDLVEPVLTDCHAACAEVLQGDFLADMIGGNPQAIDV